MASAARVAGSAMHHTFHPTTHVSFGVADQSLVDVVVTGLLAAAVPFLVAVLLSYPTPAGGLVAGLLARPLGRRLVAALRNWSALGSDGDRRRPVPARKNRS